MTNILTLPFKFAPRKFSFYPIMWGIWLATLWFLSSRKPSLVPKIEIPHLDKVLHFGYFACGAILLAGCLVLLKKTTFRPLSIILICFTVGACVGALDEYHQSHVEGRSGNDPWDWTADCMGSIAGSAYMLWGWRKKKETSS